MFARLLDSATFGQAVPRVRIRGTDFAGTVESVGEGVTRWRPGDDVFGEAGAAIADYVAAREQARSISPAASTGVGGFGSGCGSGALSA
jgi:NADPH:quinone reductase-like Zn-dependent oxidoreductase